MLPASSVCQNEGALEANFKCQMNDNRSIQISERKHHSKWLERSVKMDMIRNQKIVRRRK